MEEDYNWKLILMAAMPIALIEVYIFYRDFSNFLRWFSLILGSLLTGGIVYLKDKKKHNIFTAVGIVFLIALIVRFLRNFGFI